MFCQVGMPLPAAGEMSVKKVGRENWHERTLLRFPKATHSTL